MKKENKKKCKNILDMSKFNIVLGQHTRNGMKLVMARYNMNESQVISMALNTFFKTELSQYDVKRLNDTTVIDDWFEYEMKANKGIIEIGECSQMPD